MKIMAIIVTGFLQFQRPTGGGAFSNHFYIIQPLLWAKDGAISISGDSER